MKLIEALKATKELARKASDIREKILKHSAHLSYETPVYFNQKQQVSEWLQSYSDILKEILRLRIAIQKTNLTTVVSINVGGKDVNKSIAEWIHRRKDLALLEEMSWKALTDRNLREETRKESTGQVTEIKIVRCYEPLLRDQKIDVYSNEPSVIDGKLEVANAITNLIE